MWAPVFLALQALVGVWLHGVHGAGGADASGLRLSLREDARV